MRPLNIIVAVDMNGGFGFQGGIPWKTEPWFGFPWKTEPFSKDDFKRFKTLTENSVCIMGFKTYEEILTMKKNRGGDLNTPLLSNRESFVVTSRSKELPENPAVKFVSSIREVVEYNDISEDKNIFVIGGEKMFIEALPWTNNIYITVVKRYYECDRFFPLDYVNNNFIIDQAEQTEDVDFISLRRFR